MARLETLADWALWYAEHGLAVFPCHAFDPTCPPEYGEYEKGTDERTRYDLPKTPATEHGCKDATRNVDQIREWWTANPNCNIGITAGNPSAGLFVIDLDRHDEDADGIAAFEQWQSEHGKLPDTMCVDTPTGGRHLWYFCENPEDGYQRCTSKKKLGIDIRGTGGYVMAPPSVHPCGEVYEWDGEIGEETNFAYADETVFAFCDWVRSWTPNGESDSEDGEGKSGTTTLKDGELIELAKAAKNGERFTKLWEAREEEGEYTSNSEADFDLLKLLAFWSNRDPEQMERLFRQSERPKRNKRSGKQLDAYLTRSISRAIKRQKDAYHKSAASVVGKPSKIVSPYDMCCNTLKGIADDKLFIHDRSLSQLFANTFRRWVAYVPAWKQFVVYDGKVWQMDGGTERVDRLVKVFTQALIARCAGVENDVIREDLCSLACSYNGHDKRVGLRNDLKSELIVNANEFDTNPHLLNVQNGTLDFETMQFRPHDPADKLTRISPTAYRRDARFDAFTDTLKESVQGDVELYEYVQKLFGIICAGDVSRDFFATIGTATRSGKDTLFGALQATLGTDEDTGYSITIDKSTLQVRKFANGSAPSADRARMRGRRLILSSEFNEAVRLDAAFLKQLTGGGQLTARYMRQNDQSFTLSGIVVILANVFPILNDESVFDSKRAKAVPFDNHHNEDEIDTTLRSRLKAKKSREAILAFAVEGYRKVLDEGFHDCEAVAAKTEQFRMVSDEIGSFLANVIEPREGEHVTLSELWDAYKSEVRKDPMGQREFYARAKRTLPVRAEARSGGMKLKNVVLGYRLMPI